MLTCRQFRVVLAARRPDPPKSQAMRHQLCIGHAQRAVSSPYASNNRARCKFALHWPKYPLPERLVSSRRRSIRDASEITALSPPAHHLLAAQRLGAVFSATRENSLLFGRRQLCDQSSGSLHKSLYPLFCGRLHWLAFGRSRGVTRHQTTMPLSTVGVESKSTRDAIKIAPARDSNRKMWEAQNIGAIF